MRILKRLAFVLAILAVSLAVGVAVIGNMLAPKLSDMEPRSAPAVTLGEGDATPAATRTPQVVPAVAITDDAPTSGTLSASREDFPVYVWTGTVKDDATGKPIEGADVMILRPDISLRNLADNTFIAAITKTDAEGKYRLEFDTAAPRTAHLRSPVIQATASGYRPGAYRYFYDPEGGHADFSLLPGGSISGRVEDEKGTPIAGALIGDRILIESGGISYLAYQSMPCLWTLTDRQGRFEITGLRPGGFYRLPIYADGFNPAYTPETAVGATGLTVVLKRSTTSLEVSVKTSDGHPVEGARVHGYPVVAPGSSTGWNMFGPPMSQGVTDRSGQCVLTGLIASTYNIGCNIYSTHTTPSLSVQGKEVKLAMGTRNKIELSLQPIKTISGTFIDSDTSAPVAGVRVSPDMYDRIVFMNGAKASRQFNHSVERPESTTGVDGRFSIPVSSQNEFYYRLPAGYVDNDPNLHNKTGSIKGDPSNLVYKLRRGEVLPIRVYTPDKKPAADVQIAFYRMPLDNTFTDSITTDAEGRCTLLVATGARYSMRFASKDGAFRLTETAPMAETPAELNVTLEAYGTVAGAVRLDGRPFPNMTINASVEGYSVSTATTGPDGKYLLKVVPAGTVSMSAEGWEAYSDRSPQTDPFTLAPGEQHEDADFDVQARGAFMTLVRTLFSAFQQ